MSITANPLFGISITVIVYAVMISLQKRYKRVHPLFMTSIVIILLLMSLHIPVENYQQGGSWLTFILGPATIALGVPIYKHADQIRRSWKSILSGITVGAVCGLLSTGAIVLLMGGTSEMAWTLMPKSATTPISMEVSRMYGGYPELTAVLTVLTGLMGSMMGPSLLRLCGITDETAIGVAIGTTSHGIGTARVLKDSEWMGAVSGFSMGLTGIWVSVFAMPLAWLWN
ncbi:LrgB family protein [Paenibacillus pini]|uniref:LrgA-associated membrane protein LrgB n=1 Tax=Paenibacillus pini JCM 16418 TaxID=1236976 RepID=W7YX09_9BACL|nr:LrgB family protein [Paenibacillus pini]GAF09231.1 LrgA-associated membrane protein LrgB [Paenibacillus pini JCM 16418]